MIEVFVESIRVNMTNYKRVVMLKEKTGEQPRFLPIWIGHFEADAIAIPMQNVPVNRPLTHDLLVGGFTQLGGRCLHAAITRLEHETFYAALVFDQDGRQVEMDCRPSDAIAAAVRAKVPIYVEDAVMAQSGMTTQEVEARRGDGAQPAGGTLARPHYRPGAEPDGETLPQPFEALGAATAPVVSALQWAIGDARRARRPEIGPGDLMRGLLRQERAAANRVLADLSVEVDGFQKVVDEEIERDPPLPALPPAAEAVLRRAVEEAHRLDEQTVGSEHLLLALAGATEDGLLVALDKVGVSLDAIRRQILVLLAQDAESEGGREDQPEGEPPP